MKKSKFTKRIIAVLLSFLLVFFSMNLPVSTLAVLAEGDEHIENEDNSEYVEDSEEESQIEENSQIEDNSEIEDTSEDEDTSENEETSENEGVIVGDITDLHWVEGSSATVAWGAAKNANYYAVTVTVYEVDGETVIGTSETGTTSTELDVQQQIHNVLVETGFDGDCVFVAVTVIPQQKQDGVVISCGNGADSDAWEYRLSNLPRVSKPTNLVLSEVDLNVMHLEFECEVDDIVGLLHDIYVEVGFKDADAVDSEEYQFETFNVGDIQCNIDHNGLVYEYVDGKAVIQIDIYSDMRNLLDEYDASNGNKKIISRVKLVANEGYRNSEWSDYSNTVEFMNIYYVEPQPWPTPLNVSLNDDLILEFDSNLEDPHDMVEYTGQLKIKIYVESIQEYFESSIGINEESYDENGRYHVDVSERVKELSKIRLDMGETNISVAVKYPYCEWDGYYASEWSEYSNAVKYVFNNVDYIYRIPTPTNLHLSNKYIAEFDYTQDSEYPIESALVIILKGNNAYGQNYEFSELECKDGRAKIDLLPQIKSILNQSVGNEMYFMVELFGRDETIGEYRSRKSERSNTVTYSEFGAVESLKISPDKPILCFGRSEYLGITIEPIDAHYDNIEWTSDNESVVYFDEDGKMYGESVGTANITATIGDAADTVTVTVYDISSNIKDETENQQVTDTAGEIIDDIVNNDNPNIQNTDINPEDVEQIKEEIQEAIENGDTFHTDLTYMIEYFDVYKKNWGQVQKAAGDLNAHFEGAYNIEVEMYHKDHNDEAHHIGNITELENEVTFTFDLPSGMKEQQSGVTKKYVLVRVHKNSEGELEYSPIDYVMNDDGTFTAKSNEFSGFVWVSTEEKDIPELSEAENLHWVEGSSATIAWDAVENANNYELEVTVYYDNGVDLIGSHLIDIDATEVDLQEHINLIVSEHEVDSTETSVKVSVRVVSRQKQDGVVIAKSSGVLSEMHDYALSGYIYLLQPTNLFFSEDYIAQFDYDIEEFEKVDRIHFTVSIGNYGWGPSYAVSQVNVCDDGNGKVTISKDLSTEVKQLFQYHNLPAGEYNVYFNVATTGKVQNCGSVWSEYSNSVKYVHEELNQLPTPTDLILSEDMVLEFDAKMDEFESMRDGVPYLRMEIYFDGVQSTYDWASMYLRKQYIDDNGKATIDISNFIQEACLRDAVDRETKVSVRVMYEELNSVDYVDGEWSEQSNEVDYKCGFFKLPVATNLHFSDDLIAEFDYEEIPEYPIETVEFFVDCGASNGTLYYSYDEIEWNNGRARVDISQQVEDSFSWAREYEPDIYFAVRLVGGGRTYGSLLSEQSNSVYYGKFKTVTALKIVPQKPIVCLRKSENLGITIEPVDAHYTDIEWESDNPGIVTVDDSGRIIGYAVGSANITAKIRNVTDTVTVNVYEINSNINNETENQQVTDTAGEIIDDIVNNENPNIQNTDINPEDVEQIKEEIQEAIENGDTFHTDLTYMIEYFDVYKKNWGQVQKAAGDLNAHFEGAYNIEVEMYHKDHDDEAHHIGNITELENEVTFTFDLPSGMKEQQSGVTKKYVLVRVHKNSEGELEYSPIDYVMNDDGTFTAKSNEFSGFVWVSTEEDAPEVKNVENVHWQEGSTATLIWDGVEGADRYEIEVVVSCEDVFSGNVFEIGRTITETADTAIDVQQEVQAVVGEDTRKIVFVKCKVTAFDDLEEGASLLIASSDYSEELMYLLHNDDLDPPLNLNWDPDTFELSFDPVDGANDYGITVFKADGTDPSIGGYGLIEQGSRIKYDMTDAVKSIWSVKVLYQAHDAKEPIELIAVADARYRDEGGAIVRRSEDSQPSNAISVLMDMAELNVPTNIDLDSEKSLLSFNGVEGATNYQVMFYADNGYSMDYTFDEYEQGTGKREFDLTDALKYIYRQYSYNHSGNLNFNVKVRAYSMGDTVFDLNGIGEWSDKSNTMEYNPTWINLNPPTNLYLNPDTLSLSFDRVDQATEYVIMIGNKPDFSGSIGATFPQKGQGTERIEYDLREIIEWFTMANEIGEDGFFAIVETYAYNEDHSVLIGRAESVRSNSIRAMIPVDTISLSPRDPVCYLGKSHYLGKTITPADAYYEKIDWVSDNPDVVSVDELGQITGNAVGTANITATIGDATDTVTVTVYDISSNIENETENQQVTNTAGGIIDDIVNNEDPDLQNTDINPEDVEQIKEEIQEAIDNGDTFHTDLTYMIEYFDVYKKNWGQVKQAAGDLNAHFEGAYNIEVEMYHKDHDDEAHHIGNITELENEITFTFDLPSGMKEEQSGVTKKYVLVRVHKNSEGEMEYSPIDYVMNDDGTFTAKSNEFSGFVWVSTEEDAPEVKNVENVHWQEGSTATLIWDGVEDADYYEVEVFVSHNGEEIGNTITGTTETEVDVQQEIQNVVGENDFEEVIVKAKVAAFTTEPEGNRTRIAESDYSEDLIYNLTDITILPAPQNVNLDEETLVLSFAHVANAKKYGIILFVSCDGEYTGGDTVTCWANDEGERFSIDLSDNFKQLYKSRLIYDPDFTPEKEIKYFVRVYAKDESDISGEIAESNWVKNLFEDTVLPAPQNVNLDSETLVLSFDSVEGAENYCIQACIDNESASACSSVMVFSGTIENGRESVDLNERFRYIYFRNADIAGTEGDFYVTIYAQDATGVGGKIVSSNTVSKSFPGSVLPAPQNVDLKENTFKLTFDQVEGAKEYELELVASKPNCITSIAKHASNEAENGIVSLDLYNDFKSLYQSAKYMLGTGPVQYYVKVHALDSFDVHGNIAQSNQISYTFNFIEVDSITVSPASPICFLGNSFYLGKTIEPIDAHYDSISWSSDNPDVVSVDETGKITGNAVGTANITATIGDATDTVTVTVYDISSNIKDETENQQVTDTAGGIIDDIVNNEDPDLQNTDINPEDVEQIKEEIQEAIDNGDTFHTDLTYMIEYFDVYKKNWGQVQKAAGDLNAYFEGAYNIEVEMYHKDHDDEAHHIGNITELENEVTFTFDLPTGMKEQQSGVTKKYVLVRVHKNSEGEMEYSPIDYVMNDDGTFTAKSNEFSGFVWVGIPLHNLTHVEAKDPTCTEAGNTEYWYCDDCDTYFSDETAETEIEEGSYFIAALNHLWDSGVITTEPTVEAEGVKTFTCERCKETYTESIPKLERISISNATISPIEDQVYTGTAITPEVKVKDGEKVLVKDMDYTVSYEKNIEVGTATVTVTGKGNYKEKSKSATFKITAKSISSAAISPIEDQVYTGAAITPAVTVKDGEKVLVKDTDYTVSYEKNIEVGTATVTVTGKGNYKENKSTTFIIYKKVEKEFNDIIAGEWYVKYIQFVYNHGIMSGKGKSFDPNGKIKREEITQIIYSLEGKPEIKANTESSFVDVLNDKWYYNGIVWCSQNGIVGGVGNGKFGTGKNITREDFVLMLYKYAQFSGDKSVNNINQNAYLGYKDSEKVSSYARTAMNWAITNGLISGKGKPDSPKSELKLDPKGNATRAEGAAIITGFLSEN